MVLYHIIVINASVKGAFMDKKSFDSNSLNGLLNVVSKKL